MIPIDDLIEIWLRVHKEYNEKKVLAMFTPKDLSWLAEAFKYLRPDAPLPPGYKPTAPSSDE
jgi:hypothetical protein